MRKKLLALWLVVLFVHTLGIPARVAAQATAAVLFGTVADSSGAVVPGVTFRITNQETGLSRTVQSNNVGGYRAPQLPAGLYEVEASLSGFQTQIKRLQLTVGQEGEVNFLLAVGPTEQRVEVTETVPLVQSTTSQISGIVGEREIRELPLNGRSFQELALLQPGVKFALQSDASVFGGRGQKISINGNRFNATSFLLDGTNINDTMNRTPASVAGTLAGVETVREYQVLTNTFQAQYGRLPAGVINAVTKSGTNEFHGTAFAFLRNSALDARNFFDPRIPPFRRNQFGGVFGGPIRRNRTFFFAGYEGLRERKGVSGVATVPTADQRARAIPTVVPYLALYPLPNAPNNQFRFSLTRQLDDDFGQIRVDHAFSDTDSFFARHTIDDGRGFRPKTNQPASFALSEGSRNQYLTLQETHVFSPAVLNTLRFGFNRSRAGSFDTPIVALDPSLSFIPGRPFGSFTVSGLSPVGAEFTLPLEFTQNLYEYSDDLDIIRGRHSFRLGALVERFQYNTLQDLAPGGIFNFTSVDNFMAGIASTFSGPLLGRQDRRSTRQTLAGFYLQDDFRLRSSLTLNLGIRYEYITIPAEVRGRQGVLLNPYGGTVTPGQRIWTENPSLRNFSPRVGLAWNPGGNSRWVARSGFGIFYNQLLADFYVLAMHLQPPAFINGFVTNPVFPRPFSGVLGTPDLSTQSSDAHVSSPYIVQYNFNVQYQMTKDTVLTAAYVGSHGVKLPNQSDFNIANRTILPDGRSFFGTQPNGATLPRRNPNFGSMRYFRTGANSFYNSMQLKLLKQFSHGFHFETSYTFARNVDQASAIYNTDTVQSGANTGLLDPDNLKMNQSLSELHVAHDLSINYSWELPFGSGRRFARGTAGVAGKLLEGWRVTGITVVRSGLPFTINEASNRSRTGGAGSRGAFQDRPDLLLAPGCSNNPIQTGNPNRYYNPGCFTLSPLGFFGNLGRNTLVGPGLVNFDFSVVKETHLTEKRSLEFRAEFFNIFNHPNFSVPSGLTIFDAQGRVPANAGAITSTVTDPREIQFALKFVF